MRQKWIDDVRFQLARDFLWESYAAPEENGLIADGICSVLRMLRLSEGVVPVRIADEPDAVRALLSARQDSQLMGQGELEQLVQRQTTVRLPEDLKEDYSVVRAMWMEKNKALFRQIERLPPPQLLAGFAPSLMAVWGMVTQDNRVLRELVPVALAELEIWPRRTGPWWILTQGEKVTEVVVLRAPVQSAERDQEKRHHGPEAIMWAAKRDVARLYSVACWHGEPLPSREAWLEVERQQNALAYRTRDTAERVKRELEVGSVVRTARRIRVGEYFEPPDASGWLAEQVLADPEPGFVLVIWAKVQPRTEAS